MTGAGESRGRLRRALSPWAWAAAAAGVLWLAGLVWFAEAIPEAVAEPERKTDAVVVLTGGAGRLSEGIELVGAGKAKKLFVSGVYRGVDVTQILRMAHQQGENLDCCLVLGHDADDTRGNAEETARWAREEGIGSIRLVTSNYHMRRSLLEFRRRMPEVEIVPHPVFPPEFKARGWWSWPGTFRLVVLEYVKYLVAVARPL